MLRPPMSSSELGRWIAEHKPELAAELGPMKLDDARIRLNEITGLNVETGTSIMESIPRFLEALKAQHNK